MLLNDFFAVSLEVKRETDAGEFHESIELNERNIFESRGCISSSVDVDSGG